MKHLNSPISKLDFEDIPLFVSEEVLFFLAWAFTYKSPLASHNHQLFVFKICLQVAHGPWLMYDQSHQDCSQKTFVLISVGLISWLVPFPISKC